MPSSATPRPVDTAALRRRWKVIYASRREFCEAAGISLTYAKYIEAGTHQPSPRILRDIAAALSCDVEDLCRDDVSVAA